MAVSNGLNTRNEAKHEIIKKKLSPSLPGPTHLLRWAEQTDVAFYFFAVLRINIERLNIERSNVERSKVEFYNVEQLQIDRLNVEIL
jgi:hypothetical protein